MSDVRARTLAASQFNRVSRRQLLALGFTASAIQHALTAGRLVIAEPGVLAFPPVLAHDDWGKWMGATLTEPGTILSRRSATAAHGLWHGRRAKETVTRPGIGGPSHLGGLVVHRSATLEGDRTRLNGIPITTVPRTLLDMAAEVSPQALARLVREAVRLERCTLAEIGDTLGASKGRRGAGRLSAVLVRYSGLPLQRARSGAEIRALETLRAAGRQLPLLNVRIAGEEADLVWAGLRTIIEIDGGPFHLDVGEDARKEALWVAAGWTVLRLPSDDVYERPHHLLELAPNVRE